VHAARLHAREEALEQGEPHRVGIARPLQPQHQDTRACIDAPLHLGEVGLERGGRAEEHLAFETEHEDARAGRIAGQELAQPVAGERELGDQHLARTRDG